MTALLAMGLVAAGVTSLVLVALARRLFSRWGFVDHPGDLDISSQGNPSKPVFGIAVAFSHQLTKSEREYLHSCADRLGRKKMPEFMDEDNYTEHDNE